MTAPQRRHASQHSPLLACAAALVLQAALLAPAQTSTGFRGTIVQQFSRPADAPLMMPTTAAVAPDGTVYVADGTNDRIVAFAPNGDYVRELRGAGDDALSRPIGVKVDRNGAIWVADTGHRRVVVFTPDGSTQRVIPVPDVSEYHAGGVTDLALSPDETQLWVVSNQDHFAARLDLATGAWTRIGSAGESLGEFNFPFLIAAGPNGDFAITDVLNTRVQMLSGAGTPVAAIGAYGARIGELYRPKGVAIDAAGIIWASDSVLGVVQAFRPVGGVIDVLRDEKGQPLRFAMPCGLAFDRAGALYVVELGANRVSKIGLSPAPAAEIPIPMPRSASVGPQQSRSCTICHVEWLPGLGEAPAGELIALPDNPKDDPHVARSETCLSCHDGSIVDSRRRVWSEHGHRTGVAPPAGMKVPPVLPLIDGKLACRTCHSAHGSGSPEGDIRKAVFLRVPNPASELCKSCHTDKIRGPRFGTHPTGGMPWSIPQVLVDAGAKVGPDPRELTCQVCHTPHGAKNDHLLVIGTSSNQLCLSCHDQMRPGMFRSGGHSEHPLEAEVNAEQKAAIAALGTKLGPNDNLVCLSCHKLHHGKGERFLLADDLAEGQMCLRCHSDRKIMVGTPHDLRTNFPKERNRLGMTVETGGPCSACHLFHRYAREFVPTPEDPTGKCTTCHNPGKVAEKRALGSVNHPNNATCLDCHNPHQPKYGKFLRDCPENVCAKCHSDKLALIGGMHDSQRDSGAWPLSDTATSDRCLACHRPHGDETTGLLRVPATDPTLGADGACVACHSTARWPGQPPMPLAHTQTLTANMQTGGLPLTPGHDGSAPHIACKTCHNPHGSPEQSRLLRVDSGQAGEQLCIRCHSETQHIVLTAHGAIASKDGGPSTTSCRPCHSVHAMPDQFETHLLWPVALAEKAATAVPPVSDPNYYHTADLYCVGCHREGGVAKLPQYATHPVISPLDTSAVNGESVLPLFDELGRRSPTGRITCRTCHLSHGRGDRGLQLPFDSATSRLAQLQVRTLQPTAVCVSCHGADALRRFLYFHDPTRRGGPVETASR